MAVRPSRPGGPSPERPRSPSASSWRSRRSSRRSGPVPGGLTLGGRAPSHRARLSRCWQRGHRRRGRQRGPVRAVARPRGSCAGCWRARRARSGRARRGARQAGSPGRHPRPGRRPRGRALRSIPCADRDARVVRAVCRHGAVARGRPLHTGGSAGARRGRRGNVAGDVTVRPSRRPHLPRRRRDTGDPPRPPPGAGGGASRRPAARDGPCGRARPRRLRRRARCTKRSRPDGDRSRRACRGSRPGRRRRRAADHG